MGPPGGPIFGTVFKFIFWNFWYQGYRSATFWFHWSFVAYGDRKGNCSNSLCLWLITKRNCHFLFVARVSLCCWFCDFAVSFLVPPDGPKNGTVKVLFFCSFTKLCMRSQKWDRQAGPIFGTVFKFIFWNFWYQGYRSATFWFHWSFVAYGDRKGNCSNSLCLWLITKAQLSFFVCCTGQPLLLILRFCGLIFGTARRSQKWDRESAFLLFFY